MPSPVGEGAELAEADEVFSAQCHPSLPCVKGGAEQVRGGGIVKGKNSKKYNPSVSFADSSLCTREPFIESDLSPTEALKICC